MTLPPLAPAPNTIGLHSPALGPWFTSGNEVLPVPAGQNLFLPLTLGGTPGAENWLPPANGFLSFYVATPTRPRGLAGLRNSANLPAFNDGNFVALFRLLPEVEERLNDLSAAIPSIAALPSAGALPRPRVRSLAIELLGGTPTWAAIEALLPTDFAFPADVSGDEEKANHVGLTTVSGLDNGPLPMSDLRRPGLFLGSQQMLLSFPGTGAGTTVNLWAFDHRGRPIDPGAVAQWWTFMTACFGNLWAPGGNQVIATTITAGRSVHFVNAQEGPVDPLAMGRLVLTGTAGGVNPVQAVNAAGAVTVTFTAAPAPPAADNFPAPLAAVLPDGQYAVGLVTAWPTGPLVGIPRDFCRIALESMEHQLTGQRQIAPGGSTAPAIERAADQARASTGLRPMRAARGCLQATNDLTTANLPGVFAAGGANTLVTSILNRDWGASAVVLPMIAAPTTAPDLTVLALDGGGVAVADVAIDQDVLVQLTFDATLAGAWVRVWSQGFDAVKAEHVRLDGGAAPIDAGGLAQVVVRLPDGRIDIPNASLMAIDILVVTAMGLPAYFPELRFDRPDPGTLPGPVDIAGITGPVLITANATQVVTVAAGSVPPGTELVDLGTVPPQLISLLSLADNQFTAATVIAQMGAGDIVQLTQAPFQTQSNHRYASGEAPTSFTNTGAAASETVRPVLISGIWEEGVPLPGMDRLEVVLANLGGQGLVASTASHGRLHELLPHIQGQPGAPAAPEVHGAGAFVNGRGSVVLNQYTRDRTAGDTVALVTLAANTIIPVPAALPQGNVWTQGLRTEAAGVASEIGIDLLLDPSGLFPFGDTWANIRAWFIARGLPDPGLIPPGPGLTSAIRALERRVLVSSKGARESATALAAAINRAEDFIYIETPAIDDLTLGNTDDTIRLWRLIRNRMDAVPALHVIVCLPLALLPGTPEELERVRNDLASAAINDIIDETPPASPYMPTRGERFVVFNPAAGPGRSLRIASTSVVIDDAFAVTGSSHLWRRGLSFDSSYALSVFDELNALGRSLEVFNFRRALMANRLGVTVADIPHDPDAMVRVVRRLLDRGGLGRTVVDRIRPPDSTLTTVDPPNQGIVTDADIWNPDGSPPLSLDLLEYLFGLLPTVYNDVFNPPQP